MDNNQQDPPEINENLQALRFEYNFRRYGVVFSPLLSLLHYAVYFHLAS